MTVLKAVVELAHVNALPADSAMNEFIYLSTETPPYDNAITEIAAQLLDFYNAPHGPAAETVAMFISSSMSRVVGVCKIHYYDITTVLSGAPAGSPFHTHSWTLGGIKAGGTDLPAEVAVAVSYHSDYEGLPERGPNKTRPRQRRRGRVFIGPLNSWAVGNTIAGRVTNNQSFRETLAGAAATMMTDTATVVNWAQWSRVNARVSEIIGGHIDDAFDTQRRRGEDPDLRTIFGSQ